MNFSFVLVVVTIMSVVVALCGADVSHLSRTYLPPAIGGYSNGYTGGYSSGYTGGYSGYPNYAASGTGYSGIGGSGYYSGGSYATPLISSSYKSYTVPQYSGVYTSPSRAYLPPSNGYNIDTKYASNGGYIY